ncbi:chorismate mutase [Pontibacter sp. BT731]|uniref:chorismate mutase n=1 Tax=Pontibacter coccineus TaxID=3063328 RepID=UPI0026E12877|nr:chorismate mutase [Pontibacter sp. BT731]MDO6389216.1 chorismate mutase [Pontibacter sp. BT731]
MSTAAHSSMKLAGQQSQLVSSKRPMVIAGPCSAESEEQMLQTALGLKKVKGVSVFRAGIWKPRTRPGSFHGVGNIGLEWLRTVKQETGLRTACEVANASQTEHALQQGVDILLIGAHTTVNPFLVQEIADALKGVHVAILVKNPVNPDLALWLGALERLHNGGITDLGAMHRGFSTLDSAPYRNHPKWEHALELRRQVPDLAMYCDASHIAGRRSLLRPVSQRALDLGYDGLMVESHHNPAAALSDAQQQIMPQELHMLLQALKQQQAPGEKMKQNAQLEKLRKEIEHLDDELLTLLSRRTKVTAQLEDYSKPVEKSAETPDPVRWDMVLENLLHQASSAGIDQAFVKNIFQEVRSQYARTHLYNYGLSS